MRQCAQCQLFEEGNRHKTKSVFVDEVQKMEIDENEFFLLPLKLLVCLCFQLIFLACGGHNCPSNIAQVFTYTHTKRFECICTSSVRKKYCCTIALFFFLLHSSKIVAKEEASLKSLYFIILFGQTS